MQVKSEALSRGSGALIAVAVHAIVLYVIATSLGIVKIPSIVKPMEAVLIDSPEQPREWKPVPMKPALAEPSLEVPESVPEVPVEIPIEPSPPVADALTTAPSAPVEASSLSVMNRVEPVYPAASRRAGEEGTAVFRVLVDERGRPNEVSVLRSSGFPRLDRAALEAIKRWKFAAATDGSQPVAAYTTVRVTFQLDS